MSALTLALSGGLWLQGVGPAHAATFSVTTNADSGAGSLREAMADANGSAGPHTISFGPGVSAITLSSALPVIKSSVTIDGAGASGGSVTIDGGGANRIFFAGDGNAITVNLANLALENGSATGGNGGASAGGGMGAGGALFINKNVTATISNVQFADNAATGGNGSGENGLSGRGGGGGLGGDGGSPASYSGAGGGGGGYHGDGGDGAVPGNPIGGGGGGGETGDGGDGTTAVAGAGGNGGGAAGGYRGDGGDGATFGGGGGGGGGYGGNGGDFGGGGGSNFAYAGDGGFGGGGGSGTSSGGEGGFGGGGGANTSYPNNYGSGGEGAGDGAGATGGGGAGLGGAIFVRDGATLTIVDSGFSGGSVTAGTGGNNGMATGTALFLGADITYRIDSGTVTLSDTLGGIGGTSDSDGGLIKTGAGVLELTGTNSYTGDTTVSAGRLVVNGAIDSSDVTVSGGTLGGSGSVGGVLVGSGGTLAPGNSIGTLSVTGNWELASGGTYEVELKNGGNTAGTHNDLTDVTGTAVIKAGSTIKVMPENGTDDGSLYTAGTRYTILTSGGLTVAGAPTISDDFAFLDFAGSYDAQNYYLTSSIPTLCLAGATTNQCATGDGVTSLGAADPVYQTVLNLANAAAGPGLDALSGEGHASTQGALATIGAGNGGQALDRVGQAFAALEAAGLLGYSAAPLPTNEGTRAEAWLRPFANYRHAAGSSNTAGLTAGGGGMLFGADQQTGNWLGGIYAGSGHLSISIPGRGTSVSSTDLTLGAYGGWQDAGTELAVDVAYTHSLVSSTRNVAVGGLNQTLTADYGANAISAFAEISQAFDAGNIAFAPYGSLGVVHLSGASFTETGGSAALSGTLSPHTLAVGEIGVRVAVEMALGTTLATITGGVGWKHAEGAAPTAVNAFAGGTGFEVTGTSPAGDAVALDLGINLDLSEAASMSLTYAGDISATSQSHRGELGLAIAF